MKANNTHPNFTVMKTLVVCTLMLVSFFAMGQSQDEKEVAARVEKFRLALIDPTENNLGDLADDHLSFGHSSGKIENKAEFIEALVSGKSNFNSIEFKDQTITLSGNVALVRHKLYAEITDGEKSSNIAIGILLIWIKKKGTWELIGRQAYKL